VDSRPDVLVYTTDPLDGPVVIAGRVKVTLWASSDALDTDFTAKLCDVYPDGRSMFVTDGIIQARHRNSLAMEELMTPGEVYRFEIDLWSTAIAFAKGHRIRLSISSSNYPRFEANPNTGEPFRKNTTTIVAHQTIYHDQLRPSHITLPAIDLSQTGVQSISSQVPVAFQLGQNYPNPFNAETIIPVKLPAFQKRAFHPGKPRRLEIFNVVGQRIRHWDLSFYSPGHHIIRWDARDDKGRPVPSGVYFYRLVPGNEGGTRKMIFLE